jgi:hypothetical protein
MKWEILGADRETGEDTSITVEAATREAAEKRAQRSGILISEVRQVGTVIPQQPIAPAMSPAIAAPQHINVGVSLQSPRSKGISGFGVAALVLGLVAAMFCWVPFIGMLSIPLSVIGLILAAVGLMISLIGQRSGVGMPIAGGVLCLLAILIAATATTAMVGVAAKAITDSSPMIDAVHARERETASRVKCASHMRQIGQALMLYADGHGGSLPPTLEVLRKSVPELSDEIFACPDARTGNYVYLPSASTSSDSIVLYEPLGNHGDEGANFLFRSGTVSWEPRSQVMRAERARLIPASAPAADN